MAARASTDSPQPDHRGGHDDPSGLGLRCTVDAEDVDVVEVLTEGEMQVHGRIAGSSNASLLVSVEMGDRTAQAVFKPERGERPLWDFPAGLWRREIAAFELSSLLGWAVVPPTVRRDSDVGEGSCQYFIAADFSEHFFTIRDRVVDGGTVDETTEAAVAQLRRIALFDIVSNNTDRKSGHVLIDSRTRIWAIDNGLSFHVDDKLRTVIWDFAGSALRDGERAALSALSSDKLRARCGSLLADDEIDACMRRRTALLEAGQFPVDATGRGIPWPLV